MFSPLDGSLIYADSSGKVPRHPLLGFEFMLSIPFQVELCLTAYTCNSNGETTGLLDAGHAISVYKTSLMESKSQSVLFTFLNLFFESLTHSELAFILGVVENSLVSCYFVHVP